MATVTIRELNANVSKVVARAQAGEVVEVTRNGEVVAELHPAGKSFRRGSPEWKKAYEELMRLLDRGIPFGRTFTHDERNG